MIRTISLFWFHLMFFDLYELPLPASNSHSFHSSLPYLPFVLICLASKSLHKKPSSALGLYLNALQLGSIEHAIATRSLLPLIDLP